jgi:V/A-type H+-transporting ATPase subunit E
MVTEGNATIDVEALSKRGTEKIVEKILSDARTEAQDIRTYAETQVQDILNSAMKEANAERDSMLKKGRQEAETEKSRIVSQARLDMRKKVLEAKEQQIKKVLDETKRTLSDAKKIPQFEQVMEQVTVESCVALKGGDLTVSTDAEGSKVLLSKKEQIEKEIQTQTGSETKLAITDEGVRGVVVMSSSGVVIDNALLTRLERRKRDIRKELASILF